MIIFWSLIHRNLISLIIIRLSIQKAYCFKICLYFKTVVLRIMIHCDSWTRDYIDTFITISQLPIFKWSWNWFYYFTGSLYYFLYWYITVYLDWSLDLTSKSNFSTISLQYMRNFVNAIENNNISIFFFHFINNYGTLVLFCTIWRTIGITAQIRAWASGHPIYVITENKHWERRENCSRRS